MLTQQADANLSGQELALSVMPDTVLQPSGIDDVRALPSFLSVLRDAERRLGRTAACCPDGRAGVGRGPVHAVVAAYAA